MKSKKNLSRRDFISKTATTAVTFTIVPRHVLGGPGFVPPSDKLTVANIGCGTQGIREMSEMLQHPNIQVVAVCDPNKFTTDYLDWSPNGIRNGVRQTLEDPNWGSQYTGIPGGRDIGKEYVEAFYSKNTTSGQYKGCASYEDFRELLEKENDIDVFKIMTPDHLHAPIAVAAMNKGINVITHKPIANRMYEGRLTIDTVKKTGVKSHLLAWDNKPEYDLILQWIEDGVIGTLKEIHNWSVRPVWPQYPTKPTETPPVPDGFNWDLWLGPVPDRPYHPHYTHNVFRGWYDFGGGSVADMGHYSLFPLFLKMGIEKPAVSAKAYSTRLRTRWNNVCTWVDNSHTFPYSCMIRFKFPDQARYPAFDLFWYDGGMKPFATEEMEEDNREVPVEGLMFVGDKGKILAGFEGANPEIIPARKMEAYGGLKTIEEKEPTNRTNTWASAILADEEPPGSFQYAGPVTETINLGAVALRSGKKVEYDTETMKITNDEAANQFLKREYREGWEL